MEVLHWVGLQVEVEGSFTLDNDNDDDDDGWVIYRRREPAVS